MREIKFRAWDGCRVKYSGLKVHADGHLECDSNLDCIDFEPVLMQYTELEDKNGVEIYQRDICLVEGLGNCEVDICSFYGAVFKKNGCEYPVVDSIAEDDLFEVIGNIYENPELLESK